MWKKHGKEIVGYAIGSIFVVLALLLMVYVFEYFGIHVPGNREMWIGLIGAVLGGAFTLLGVVITIYKQEESEKEQKRLENMPVLGFDIIQMSLEESFPLYILGMTEGQLVTSGFPGCPTKKYSILEISVANKKPVFNLVIDNVFMSNAGVLEKSEAFSPCSVRIVSDERVQIMIYYADELLQNEFMVIRISYADILGNKYYQDVPFDVFEREIDECGEQLAEIRDIKCPIYVEKYTEEFSETVKGFMDYRIEISE